MCPDLMVARVESMQKQKCSVGPQLVYVRSESVVVVEW